MLSVVQVVDFFNGNLKRRRQKRKEAKAMMKLKRLSTIHTEANGAVIGDIPQRLFLSHTNTDRMYSSSRVTFVRIHDDLLIWLISTFQ